LRACARRSDKGMSIVFSLQMPKKMILSRLCHDK
jgi:hypothetical protein